MIKFIKQVTFKDMYGTILKVYKIGDKIKFTSKNMNGAYYVTGMGGIYFDEATEV